MTSIDNELTQAWAVGVCRDDAGRLRELLADPLPGDAATALGFFAALALLAEGQAQPDPAFPSLDLDPHIRVIGYAAAAWAAIERVDIAAAAQALSGLEAAVSQVEAAGPTDPRTPVALAVSDLALARIALSSGDSESARRRLGDAARGPLRIRLLAESMIAIEILGRDSPAAAATALETLSHTARVQQLPQEEAHARTHAGLFAALAGDAERARRHLGWVIQRSRSLPRRYVLIARLFLAQLSTGGRRFSQLAAGLREAAATGDYPGYVTYLVLGARWYARRGRAADAVLTLSAGIEQLRRAHPDEESGLLAPLLDERLRLQEELGEEAYRRAVDGAERIIATELRRGQRTT